MVDIEELKEKIDYISKQYLRHIALTNKNPFMQSEQQRIYGENGFYLVDNEQHNRYIVKKENAFEGCTRVLLINPVIKTILDAHSIDNEWPYDSTYGNQSITNRQNENQYYLEFIAVINSKRIGIRYTPNAFAGHEIALMLMSKNYGIGKNKIPFFDRLSPIDKVYCIDWTDIIKKEPPKYGDNLISLETFFLWFSTISEYQLFFNMIKKTIEEARRIMALVATPQLIPSNTLLFKEAVLESFSDENLAVLQYEFADNKNRELSSCLSQNDLEKISEMFSATNLKESIIGNSDFSKSFITSEYLYQTIHEGLSIDYTAIVVGYLKSVEQLLYIYYKSAFKDKKAIYYWDNIYKDSRKKAFNIEDSRYRYDPYTKKEIMQEYYPHKKKVPEIGELIRFLRYYSEMWNVSELGKEYIFACLDDYRSYCRNSYFHKDNIDYTNYDTVRRIRNNTIVCIYYIVGGFILLDDTIPLHEQLGIIDYSFERLYRMISQRVNPWYVARFDDNSEIILYYLDNRNIQINNSGAALTGEISFVKISNLEELPTSITDVEIMIKMMTKNPGNVITITPDHMPEEFKPLKRTHINR